VSLPGFNQKDQLAIFPLDDRNVSQMHGTRPRRVAHSMQKDSISMHISILRLNTTPTRLPTYCAQAYQNGPRIHLHFCPQTKWILSAGLAAMSMQSKRSFPFLHIYRPIEKPVNESLGDASRHSRGKLAKRSPSACYRPLYNVGSFDSIRARATTGVCRHSKPIQCALYKPCRVRWSKGTASTPNHHGFVSKLGPSLCLYCCTHLC
jgi:hypothetical protein